VNKSLAQSKDSKSVLTSTYYTPITYHTKSPQFYDEVKILLPLNLSERHHLFFRFYHVSCSSAKSASIAGSPVSKLSPGPTNFIKLDFAYEIEILAKYYLSTHGVIFLNFQAPTL
jgi:hypothetical protein